MSDEKTEEPTPHKLKKAREEGQMAKSQDVAVAASTLAVVGALAGTARGIGEHMHRIVQVAFDFSPASLADDILWKRVAQMAFEAIWAILPLVLAAAFGAAVGMAAHVGFQITPQALEPKFDSLNPASGIKKVFSMKSLLTFAQTLLKAVVIGIVLWRGIVALLPLVSGAVWQSPDSIGAIAWKAVMQLVTFALAVFVVLAPLDYALQRHLFMKGQKMSKDEIKREFKGQEGDPEVKGQRKQLAREFANEAPKKAVGRADAVVVNPTHYAVAIRYRADEAGVPVVLAKGVDEMALRLRGYAQELGTPVFAHPPLARSLYRVPVDHAVPEELFEAVSVVLKWVEEIGAHRPDAAPAQAAR